MGPLPSFVSEVLCYTKNWKGNLSGLPHSVATCLLVLPGVFLGGSKSFIVYRVRLSKLKGQLFQNSVKDRSPYQGALPQFFSLIAEQVTLPY